MLFAKKFTRYEKTWVRPNLTSNTSYGTLTATSEYSSEGVVIHDAFHAFSTEYHQWISSGSSGLDFEELVWTLPNNEKIYISQLDFYIGDIPQRFPKSITVYGSNNGITFKPIGFAKRGGDYLTNAEYHLTVNCNNSVAYNIIKFSFEKSGHSDNLTAVAEITFTAYTPSTSDDYDTTLVDTETYLVVKNLKRQENKNPWILSAPGSISESNRRVYHKARPDKVLPINSIYKNIVERCGV